MSVAKSGVAEFTSGWSYSFHGDRPKVFRRRLAGLLAAVLAGVLLGAPAEAADYLVDCSRISAASHRASTHRLWHTIADVNAFAAQQGFRAGDRILLRRGCRWREQLQLVGDQSQNPAPNSGSPDKPLVIASFGSGDLPTIDGADPLAGWKDQGHGVYSVQTSGPVYKIFVDGESQETEALLPQPNFDGSWQPQTAYFMWDYILYQGKTLGAVRDVDAQTRFSSDGWYHAPNLPPVQLTTGIANVLRTPGSWYFDSRAGVLYVHLRDGGNPSLHRIDVTRRCYGIHLNGVSHAVVDSLRIIHAAKSGVLADVFSPNRGSLPPGNEFNTIENSVFWNDGDNTVDTLPVSRLQIEGAISIAPSTVASDHPLRGWVVRNNAVGMTDGAWVFSYNRSGISAIGTDGLLLQNNYIAAQQTMGVSVYTDHGPRCLAPRIEGNYFTASQGNLRVSGCTNPVIDSNIIAYSYGYGIQTGGNSSGAVVTHNLIHHLTVTPKANLFNGVDCNGGAPGGTLAFNTIESVWAADATLEIGCDHWSVHDNVFDSSNNAQHGGLTLYIRHEALAGMTFRHNLYKVDPQVTRQFNVGAGQPGAKTFHDLSWWHENVEPSAVVATGPLFADGARGNYALRRAGVFGPPSQIALPVHPFVPTAASTVYLQESPHRPWQPQDTLRR
jgi:hypothetical protein